MKAKILVIRITGILHGVVLMNRAALTLKDQENSKTTVSFGNF
jgi:hypothetical protein